MKSIETIEGVRICGDSVKILGKKGKENCILNIKISNGTLKILGPFGKKSSKSGSLNKMCGMYVENLGKLIKKYNSEGELAQDGTNLDEVDNYSFWKENLYVLKKSGDGTRKLIIYDIRNNSRILTSDNKGISPGYYKRLSKQIDRFNDHQDRN